MTAGVDFSNPNNWFLSKSLTSHISRQAGLCACIYPSKIPKSAKYGCWVKEDKPDNFHAEPLFTAYGDSLKELMLEVEVARRKREDSVARPEPAVAHEAVARPVERNGVYRG